jgi:hypothetical protein
MFSQREGAVLLHRGSPRAIPGLPLIGTASTLPLRRHDMTEVMPQVGRHSGGHTWHGAAASSTNACVAALAPGRAENLPSRLGFVPATNPAARYLARFRELWGPQPYPAQTSAFCLVPETTVKCRGMPHPAKNARDVGRSFRKRPRSSLQAGGADELLRGEGAKLLIFPPTQFESHRHTCFTQFVAVGSIL